MKTIIAGSRNIRHPIHIERAVLFAGIPISEVVCGLASGVDMTGYQWANSHDIPIAVYPAKWDVYGHGAGMARNLEMRDYADALIAVWDGESRGTANMIWLMRNKGKRVFVHMVDLKTDPHEIDMRKRKMGSWPVKLPKVLPVPAKFVNHPNEGEEPLP